jgi:hypothetical protein
MATKYANITWDEVPGSYGTLVEYRLLGDSVWTKPTTPDNPTLSNTYTIELETGQYYYVRLTTLSNTCGSQSITKRIFVPTESDTCCTYPYLLAPDGSYCYYEEEVAATAPSGGTAEIAVDKSNVAYATCGSYIYDPGYNLDGTGTSTQITTANTFWANGGTCTDNNTIDGPLNRAGLWATTTTDNQDVGFSVCVDIPESKTYYVGIGCDNYGILKLDGVTVVEQDATALGVQYSVGVAAAFKVWHIYPIDLTAGPHIIEMIGHNVSSAAALGAEIYDATSAELIAATSYVDLGAKLIFSTKDMIGQEIQIGSGGLGYTCPDGYALASCETPPVCRKILTTIPTPC